MTASRGKLLHHVIVPVALLVAVSMAVVVGFTWFSARKQDEVASGNRSRPCEARSSVN